MRRWKVKLTRIIHTDKGWEPAFYDEGRGEWHLMLPDPKNPTVLRPGKNVVYHEEPESEPLYPKQAPLGRLQYAVRGPINGPFPASSASRPNSKGA